MSKPYSKPRIGKPSDNSNLSFSFNSLDGGGCIKHTRVTGEDARKLVDSIINPPAPTDALIALRRKR
jgi:hypothetical protein